MEMSRRVADFDGEVSISWGFPSEAPDSPLVEGSEVVCYAVVLFPSRPAMTGQSRRVPYVDHGHLPLGSVVEALADVLRQLGDRVEFAQDVNHV